MSQENIKIVGKFNMNEIHNLIDLLFLTSCKHHVNFYSFIFWNVRAKNE